MKYYLRHYFNPDFDHQRAKPGGGLGTDEGADVYSLGYAQNAIPGQILAEILPADKAPPDADKRYFRDSAELPAGANTRVDPAWPNYLLSAAKGYVFYNQGKITVKSLLNVRQDVSFHTGNIYFVGDICVHGSVRSGFSVQGDNVRISGMVEGGIARARRDLMVEGGCRGGSSKHCLLDAGGKLLTPFVEKAEARARQNMVIEKYCLYSTVFAGANMIVHGQMYGVTAHCLGSVYVGAQIGNRAGIATRVYLGYDPFAIRQLEKIDGVIASLTQTVTHLNAVAGHLDPDTNETTRKLATLSARLDRVIRHRTEIWNSVSIDEAALQKCRLMVPGKVYPGVEISIGKAFMQVERTYNNAMFRLCYDEIVVETLPDRKAKL